MSQLLTTTKLMGMRDRRRRWCWSAWAIWAVTSCALTHHARLRDWATAVLPGDEVVAQLGDEVLSVWVAADDAGPEPHCLQFVPGNCL